MFLESPKITPFLLFPGNAEEAARFYVSVFDDSRIVSRHAFDAGGQTCVSITFRIAGQTIIGFNGGPPTPFSLAHSLMVSCASQEELDRYWNALADGGKPIACGWIEDRFGLTWQIVPEKMQQLLIDVDPVRHKRVMEAMQQMVKLDLATLEAAYRG